MGKKKFLATLAMAVATVGASSMVAHAVPQYYPEELDLATRGNSYDWGRHAIHWAFADSVTVGDKDGKFNPDQSITRAEAVTMLTKLKGLDASQYSEDSKVFKDVNGAWYTSYVNAAYINGIVAGKAKDVFAPNDTLTRAEAVTMIVKAMEYKGSKDSKATFTDISDGWYTDFIKTGYDNKIVSGKSDKIFDPNGNVTRAEYVMMLYNSVMGANEKGSYCAVMLYDYSDSFKIMSADKVLLSYDKIEQKVEGAGKVTAGEDWKMAYFAPTNSFEVEFDDGYHGFLRFFANGKEYTINTYDVKKIAFAEDGSVEFYRNKDAELFPWVAISASDNMKLEVASGESTTIGQKMENGFELFNDYYENMRIDTVRHKTSEYVKCTPMKDNSTVEMCVNFAVGGIEITSSIDGDVYLYEMEDGAKKLVIDDKVYDIDMEIDTDYFEFDIFSLDYDHDGQKDYLLEVASADEAQGKGLYLIKLNEDQTAELTKIDNGNFIQKRDIDKFMRVYGLQEKADEALFHCFGQTFLFSTADTDLLKENPDAKELMEKNYCDANRIFHDDFDGDGEDEYAVISTRYYFADAEKKEVDYTTELYVIDKIGDTYKAVKCPKVNIDELPNAKARIEGEEGFKEFNSKALDVHFDSERGLEWWIDFTVNDAEFGEHTVHYEAPIKYHADGTFSYEDSTDGQFSVG